MDWIGGTLGTKVLLLVGLSAVGLQVRLSALSGAGAAPWAVGAAGAGLVGGVGLGAALLSSSLARASGIGAAVR